MLPQVGCLNIKLPPLEFPGTLKLLGYKAEKMTFGGTNILKLHVVQGSWARPTKQDMYCHQGDVKITKTLKDLVHVKTL